MTLETTNFLHRIYNEVLESKTTINLIDILVGLKEKCLEYKIPAEDSDEFDAFLRNVESSIRIRKRTFEITTFVSNVVLTMCYIAIWANITQKLGIDINIKSRRKALESELTKFVLKGHEIHDRFGVRGVCLNNDSDDESIETQKLLKFELLVKNVLCQSKSNKYNDYHEFYEWVKKQSLNGDENIIFSVLKIPFKIVDCKNYISNPKANGYQSLHTVFMVEMYSDILPGSEFEFQLRTHKMHQNASTGEASHNAYKEHDKELRKIFRADIPESVNVTGFTNYDDPDGDIDGLFRPKVLCNRRVSASLIDSGMFVP